MRYLVLSVLVIVGVAYSAPSPRYQLLTDSLAEKKPLVEAIKTSIGELKEKIPEPKPAHNLTKKKKGVVTTIVESRTSVDSSAVVEDTVIPSTIRSFAGSLVLFDTPIIPLDSAKLQSLEVDTVGEGSDPDTDTTVYDGDTTVKDGDQVGYASWYGPGLNGKRTASGERFDMTKMTAAHRSYPFGTIIEITNIATGKSVRVRVNDRGPHRKDRMVDLSKKAASKIGITSLGYAKVKMRVIK